MDTYMIMFKLVRSFSIGFTIHSPKLNGFSVEFCFACFILSVWGKGRKLFAVRSYWKG